MARRKAIYLELYPETGNGKTKGNQFTGQERENDTVSFSQDTAVKTQTSKRTVERNVEIGEVLGNYLDDAPPDFQNSAVDFTWSLNGMRRNLTLSQRAFSAVETLLFYEAEAKKNGNWQR